MPALSASSTTSAFHALGHGVDEAVVDALGHDQARGGRAALAGREEGAVDGAFDRDLEIGVVEHDQRILAAHLELHLLHRVGRDAGCATLRAGGDRAGEGDRVDVLGLFSIASPTTEPRPMTRLNTPVGRPARAMISDKRMRRRRHEIGRLEHDAIAVGERRRDLPGRNGDREIPRRDQADDADRLARDLDVDAGPHRGELLAGQAQALAGEEQEDLPGAHDLADALGQGLAFLARQQAAELVLAREDLVADALQDVVALLDRGARPGREGRLRGRDRALGIGGARRGRTRRRRRWCSTD